MSRCRWIASIGILKIGRFILTWPPQNIFVYSLSETEFSAVAPTRTRYKMAQYLSVGATAAASFWSHFGLCIRNLSLITFSSLVHQPYGCIAYELSYDGCVCALDYSLLE